MSKLKCLMGPIGPIVYSVEKEEIAELIKLNRGIISKLIPAEMARAAANRAAVVSQTPKVKI